MGYTLYRGRGEEGSRIKTELKKMRKHWNHYNKIRNSPCKFPHPTVFVIISQYESNDKTAKHKQAAQMTPLHHTGGGGFSTLSLTEQVGSDTESRKGMGTKQGQRHVSTCAHMCTQTALLNTHENASV